GWGEIRDPQGERLGYYDPSGAVRDPSGQVLLMAPIESRGRRARATQVAMPISSAQGQLLGRAQVTKTFLGPRAKRVTIEVSDPVGNFVMGCEPRDKLGLQLAVTSGYGDLAGVAVEEQGGVFRRTRIYRVSIYQKPPDAWQPLVLATLSRFDALLGQVEVASASRDRDRMDS
ncbi:MAG: hypothetical protein M3198_00280, partial [Actinomycetota bacterium]|nr:hypothetical protein [Actinomycetota bacterium]